MRWVVELPAPSGGTAASVTVEADSWAGALSSARNGASIKKFRCEFENEGVVRVHDLEANERYTVRPYRASSAPAADTRPSEAPAAASMRGTTIPPSGARTSRVPPAGGGSFSVAPPPGTSVALPPRSSTPPTSPIAADPTADIDVPSSISGTVVGMFAPAAPPSSAVEKPAEVAAPAPAPVADKPVEVAAPAPAPVAEKPAEAAAPVPVEKPVEVAAPAPTPVVEKPVEVAPAKEPEPAVVETPKAPVVDDLAATSVDLPVFVAPTPSPSTASPVAADTTVAAAPPVNGTPSEPPVVPVTVLFERDQDPGPTNPLTYRERVLCVADGTSVGDAEAVARQHFGSLKRSLATRPRGRYVTVAVFDHAFAQRPSHSPLVVLRWKDWRGDAPEVLIRPALAPTPAPAPVAVAPIVNGSESEAAKPAEAVVATPAPEPVVEAPATPAEAPPAPVEAPVAAAPVAEPPAPSPEPAPAVEAAAPVPPAAEAVAPAPSEPATTTEPAAVTAPTEVAAAPSESPTTEATSAPDAAPPVAPEASTASTTDSPAAPAPEAEPSMVVAPEAVAAPATTPEVAVAEESKPAADVTASADAPAASETPTPAPVETPAPAAVEAPAPAAPAPERKRFAGGRRGPDLLSDLFDAMMELSFLKESADICAFVSNIITHHLKCDAVLVFSYDINRDEFVVQGEANTGRLEQRVRANAGSYGTAARSKRLLSVANCREADRADVDCEGGAALFVPGVFHDRLFALLQIARLPGAPAFEADELDAATYVAGQLAEALASHSHRQAVHDLADRHPARR